MLAHTTTTAGSEPRGTRAAARRAAVAGPIGRRYLLLAALALGLVAAPPVAAQGGPPPFGGAQGAPAPPAAGAPVSPAAGAPVSPAAGAPVSPAAGVPVSPAAGVPASPAAGAPVPPSPAGSAPGGVAVSASSAPTGVAVSASSAVGSAGIGTSGPSVDELARMAEAVNAIRAENSRAPLKLQAQLSAAAQRQADAMAQTRTLSHMGPAGSRPSDRMGAAGYETCGGGENVAFGVLQTVDDIARGWYDSPSHRELLLHPNVREMGIGRAQTSDGLVYWALEVGQRPSVAPIVVNQEAAASATSSVTVYVYPQVADYCLGPARQIVQVLLSNAPDFADAQSFAYSATIPWTLAAGEGPRTVYARLTDDAGRVLETQDTILVSSTAPAPNTATNVSPPVQTVTVTGQNGQPTQLTIYRTSYVLPSDGALTVPPCGNRTGPCWNVGDTSLPAATGAAASFPGAPNPAGRQLGAMPRGPSPYGVAPAPPVAPGPYAPAGPAPGSGLPGYGAPVAPTSGGANAGVLPGGPTPASPSGNCPNTGLC